MIYQLEIISDLALLNKMLEEAKLEQSRYTSRLGSSARKSYYSKNSQAERISDRVTYQAELASAEQIVATADPTTKTYKKASLAVDHYRYKLKELDYEEATVASPDELVMALFEKDVNEALVAKYDALIAGLQTRISEISPANG